MTESSEGANLANTIRGLKKFDGRDPAEFKTWMKKLCVVISVTRRDILPLLKETARPTHTSNIAEYNRANEDLYAMLFLLVELPASLCVQKHEKDDEISGDGQAAFKELCNTYDKVTDEVIRATMEELVNTPMEPGQNPDDYFNQKRLLRIRAEKMGEHISDRYFKDICVTGFTDNYKDVKMMMYRDPSFDVDQMQTTMRHMFLDEQSRNGTKGRIAGRGSVMTAVTSEQDIICYWCTNRGHSKKDCPKFKSRTKPAGAAKWCSVHRTTTHRNEECYSQGATRPTENASVSLACTNCRHCTSADSKEPTVNNTEPSHSDKPVINFAGSSDDFDGGFMYAAGMPGRFTPSAKGATLLVDSGASESFLDDELIPDLKTRMREFKTLSTPREITTAGKHTLHGIGTGIISFTIRDNHGTQLPVNMRSLVVPGLGRNIFAPTAELRNGVRFVLEKAPYLTIRGTVIPLKQDPRDQGVCSLDITFQRDSSLLEEDLFTPNCDLSSAELERQVQRLRQEVRRLSKINAAQSPSPSSTPASPGVAVDQRDAGTREPEPASPSINQEPENEDEHGPPSPAAPVTGPSLRIRSDGRPFEVTRASTRRSPSSKDTEYPGALHTLFPTHDHDPRALTSSQLLHSATQTTPSMLTTADSAHLDGQPFDTPRAFVYATGVPVHKGFSEEGQLVRIPNSYKDAQKSPQWGDWNNAIQKETDSLRKHNVYKLVKMSSVPKEEKIIGSRFVFKQKVDGRFKARLVVQGYVQEAGDDYGRSYAPVCRIGSIRTVLAIACEHGWPVWQMDVVVAFLQAHIDKDVYVKPAPGHDPRDPKTGEVMVYKLERSLYGLAQSPVLWCDTIDGRLIVIGFSPTHSDPCVYVHGSGDTLIILTLYVDDILLTGKDPVLVDQKKRELKERFEMTDMGEVIRILGMEVKRDYDQGTLAITQTDYVENLLERFEMQNANVAHTPGYGQELSSEQPEDKLLGAQGIKLYQSITGSLLYLAQCTRYDLCYAVNQLTRACNRPAEVHMTAAKHVLRYLRGTPDLPITYRKEQLRLVSYTDASFGANPDNRKSTTGYLFFLGGAPNNFGSKTQSLTAQSTVESELQALSYEAREAVYLSNFLTELGLKDSSQVPIRSDSTGALSVTGNSMFSARTKRIALRYFFVRELVKKTISPFTTRRPSRCSRTSQPSTCPSTPSVISFNR